MQLHWYLKYVYRTKFAVSALGRYEVYSANILAARVFKNSLSIRLCVLLPLRYGPGFVLHFSQIAARFRVVTQRFTHSLCDREDPSSYTVKETPGQIILLQPWAIFRALLRAKPKSQILVSLAFSITVDRNFMQISFKTRKSLFLVVTYIIF